MAADSRLYRRFQIDRFACCKSSQPSAQTNYRAQFAAIHRLTDSAPLKPSADVMNLGPAEFLHQIGCARTEHRSGRLAFKNLKQERSRFFLFLFRNGRFVDRGDDFLEGVDNSLLLIAVISGDLNAMRTADAHVLALVHMTTLINVNEGNRRLFISLDDIHSEGIYSEGSKLVIIPHVGWRIVTDPVDETVIGELLADSLGLALIHSRREMSSVVTRKRYQSPKTQRMQIFSGVIQELKHRRAHLRVGHVPIVPVIA